MVNLLKISLIILLLVACSTNYEVSNKEQIHNVIYNHEDLYLDNVDFKKDKDNNISHRLFREQEFPVAVVFRLIFYHIIFLNHSFFALLNSQFLKYTVVAFIAIIQRPVHTAYCGSGCSGELGNLQVCSALP